MHYDFVSETCTPREEVQEREPAGECEGEPVENPSGSRRFTSGVICIQVRLRWPF